MKDLTETVSYRGSYNHTIAGPISTKSFLIRVINRSDCKVLYGAHSQYLFHMLMGYSPIDRGWRLFPISMVRQLAPNVPHCALVPYWSELTRKVVNERSN